MIGLYAEADHPITCINPTRYFEIVDWKTRMAFLLTDEV